MAGSESLKLGDHGEFVVQRRARLSKWYNMRVFMNGGTPKWMVYSRKSIIHG